MDEVKFVIVLRRLTEFSPEADPRRTVVRGTVSLLALICAAALPPAARADPPLPGWTVAAAPNRRVLPLDLSQLDESRLLRSGDHAAIYAIAASAGDYHRERIPLILVHGINGGPRDLQPVAQRFRGSQTYQLHVLCYDSSRRRTHENGGDFASELRALQRALGPNRELAIVAHSMGGLVSRWALNELAEGPGRGVERWRRVQFIAADSPWHGYDGPSDRGVEGLLMGMARPVIAAGLDDMRSTSNMFQGFPDQQGRDAAAFQGVLRVSKPRNVDIHLLFAGQRTVVEDYTQGHLLPLAGKIADHYNDEIHHPHVDGEARLTNFWQALIETTEFYSFDNELLGLVRQHRLTAATVTVALRRYYPKFPGDHRGVLAEHPAQRSFLDYLQQTLGAGRPPSTGAGRGPSHATDGRLPLAHGAGVSAAHSTDAGTHGTAVEPSSHGSANAAAKKASPARKAAATKKATQTKKATPAKKAARSKKGTPAKKAARSKKATPAKKAARSKKATPTKKAPPKSS